MHMGASIFEWLCMGSGVIYKMNKIEDTHDEKISVTKTKEKIAT